MLTESITLVPSLCSNKMEWKIHCFPLFQLLHETLWSYPYLESSAINQISSLTMHKVRLMRNYPERFSFQEGPVSKNLIFTKTQKSHFSNLMIQVSYNHIQHIIFRETEKTTKKVLKIKLLIRFRNKRLVFLNDSQFELL